VSVSNAPVIEIVILMIICVLNW